MKRIVNAVFILLVTGCAGLQTLVEEPDLTVTSIAVRETNSLAPVFDITLRITNPNPFDLGLVGMSYTLDLSGNRVLSGVSNNLPEIAAYGEETVTISAAVNLLGSMNLFRDILQNRRDRVDFVFSTRMDAGNRLPRFEIVKSGELPLQ